MTGVQEPAFSEPWHAQVFALTVHLNETGWLDWSDWAIAFSETLRRKGLDRDLDGGDDYFHAWVETLEFFLVGQGIADFDEIFTSQNRVGKSLSLHAAWCTSSPRRIITGGGASARLCSKTASKRPCEAKWAALVWIFRLGGQIHARR